MKSTSWEIMDCCGAGHTLALERRIFGCPEIYLDNEQLTLAAGFNNYLSGMYDVPFSVGGKECRLVITGRHTDVFCGGISLISGKPYEKPVIMPKPAWISVIVCFAAAALGGAIPALIGLACAGLCVTVGCLRKVKNNQKITLVIFISAICWLLAVSTGLGGSWLLYAVNKNKPKTFYIENIRIHLDNSFKEDRAAALGYGCEFVFASEDAEVSVKKEPKRLSAFSGNIADFANAYLARKGVTGEITAGSSPAYAEYTVKDGVADIAENTGYYYLAAIFEEDANYWIIEFSCESRNKGRLRPKFIEWAEKVSVLND